jgi:hypothetical protein
MLEELRQERALVEEAIIALQRMAAGGASVVLPKRRGRPPKSISAAEGTASPSPRRKRQLSPEGRARIAEAAKRRWAEARQQKGQN